MRLKLTVSILMLLFMLAAMVFFVQSCDQKTVKADADVNPQFAVAPPLAQDITIKQLEKETSEGNVLVAASIPELRTTFHAVMVGNEKLVLRDDGKGGDEKGGDGVFSIILKEDLNAFRNELAAEQNKNKELLQGKPLIKFVNRHAVEVPMNNIIGIRLDSISFQKGIKFPIDFFTLAPDPLLKDHSLMITDLKVIEDPTRTFNPCTGAGNPNGAWTFGKLISDMANTPFSTISAEDFVRGWLDHWMISQTINADVVNPRPNIFSLVIRPWIQRSTPGSNPTAANWKTFPLKMSLAPFKLEAIVNRLDLRGNIGYSVSNAGEGRFVFSVLDNNCRPLAFTVIFEYGIPKKTCESLTAFAKQWYDLKTMTPGSPAYNAALEGITKQFAAADADPAKPNRNALNQIRTNEIALAGPWELREFTIDRASHLLKEGTVTREPNDVFNRLAGATPANLKVLADFVNANANDVIAQKHTVPLNASGLPFLGGQALTLLPTHFWDGSTTAGPGFIVRDSARHFLSINTCSGCHGGEGMTSVGNLINDPAGASHRPFLQIASQGFGRKPTLAAFLTGDPSQSDGTFKVNDPASRPTGAPEVWKFNDLADRATKLEELVNQACRRKLPALIHILKFRPLNSTH